MIVLAIRLQAGVQTLLFKVSFCESNAMLCLLCERSKSMGLP